MRSDLWHMRANARLADWGGGASGPSSPRAQASMPAHLAHKAKASQLCKPIVLAESLQRPCASGRGTLGPNAGARGGTVAIRPLVRLPNAQN